MGYPYRPTGVLGRPHSHFRNQSINELMKDESPSSERVGVLRLIRNRVIAGLFVVLPIYITYAVVNWLYESLYSIALQPISNWLVVIWELENEEPSLFLWILLSTAALGLVLAVLYVAGMFFRSRLHQLLDWVLLNVPGVSSIYSAVSKVFYAISSSQYDASNFKRVVLVPFPHAGMKAPAFVTGEMVEENTGGRIVCVYVPTTPVPTSGYMLLFPAEEIVELNWDLEETLQAIVSGGITVPTTVTYYGQTVNSETSNGKVQETSQQSTAS